MPIEDIQAGDWVWAFNQVSGDIDLQQVVRTFERTVPELVLLELEVEDGPDEDALPVVPERFVLATTTEHPFWVVEHGWVDASALVAG